MLSCSSGAAPGRTTSSRAASRGSAGRKAMRSAGSSKSNWSMFMAPALRTAPATTVRNSDWRRATPSLRVRSRPRADDLVGILHRFAALDLVDIVHALGHRAPHRVLAVEPGRLVEADEELA